MSWKGLKKELVAAGKQARSAWMRLQPGTQLAVVLVLIVAILFSLTF